MLVLVKDKKMLKDYQNAISTGNATGIYPVSFGVVSWSLGIPKEQSRIDTTLWIHCERYRSCFEIGNNSTF